MRLARLPLGPLRAGTRLDQFLLARVAFGEQLVERRGERAHLGVAMPDGERLDQAIARRLRAGGQKFERLDDVARKREARQCGERHDQQHHEGGGRDFCVDAREHLGAVKADGDPRRGAGHRHPAVNLRRVDRGVDVGAALRRGHHPLHEGVAAPVAADVFRLLGIAREQVAGAVEQQHRRVVFTAGLGSQFVEPGEIEPDRHDADDRAVAVDDRKCHCVEGRAGHPDEEIADHEFAIMHGAAEIFARGGIDPHDPDAVLPAAGSAHALEKGPAGLGRTGDHLRHLRHHLEEHARLGDHTLIAFRHASGAVDRIGVRRFDAGLAFAIEAHAHRAHQRQRDEQDHPEQTNADAAEKRACRPVASKPPSGHGSPLVWRADLEGNLCGAIKRMRLRRVNRGL